MAAIERHLVGFFIDDRAHNYLNKKVMRGNPASLEEEVMCIMNEQNL